MEAVLDLYEEAPTFRRPRVCFDELPYQLVGQTRIPLPPRPGQPERFDYEYRRMGTANLFIVFDPDRGWRQVTVTERRTKQDFAEQMRALVDDHYPDAEVIRVVLDNLNTHTPAALYAVFAPAEARRIVSKLQFEHTPKHGSWLNQAEIEWSLVSAQCLNRRIADRAMLEREVAAWQAERNAAKATVDWRFTSPDARTKLKRLYPVKP